MIQALAQIFHLLYTHKIELRDFAQVTPGLEDVFLSIIREKEED